MINLFPDGCWDATEYFEHLTATNRLAKMNISPFAGSADWTASRKPLTICSSRWHLSA